MLCFGTVIFSEAASICRLTSGHPKCPQSTAVLGGISVDCRSESEVCQAEPAPTTPRALTLSPLLSSLLVALSCSVRRVLLGVSAAVSKACYSATCYYSTVLII